VIEGALYGSAITWAVPEFRRILRVHTTSIRRVEGHQILRLFVYALNDVDFSAVAGTERVSTPSTYATRRLPVRPVGAACPERWPRSTAPRHVLQGEHEQACVVLLGRLNPHRLAAVRRYIGHICIRSHALRKHVLHCRSCLPTPMYTDEAEDQISPEASASARDTYTTNPWVGSLDV
jgi:hypothetical protein